MAATVLGGSNRTATIHRRTAGRRPLITHLGLTAPERSGTLGGVARAMGAVFRRLRR